MPRRGAQTAPNRCAVACWTTQKRLKTILTMGSLSDTAEDVRKAILISMVFAVLGALFLVGCAQKPSTDASRPSTAPGTVADVRDAVDMVAVNTVKSGTFPQYQTTTIGKAFEGTFQNPKWRSFTGKKGANVVEFTGIIPALELVKAGIDRPHNEDCIVKALEEEKRQSPEAKAQSSLSAQHLEATPEYRAAVDAYDKMALAVEARRNARILSDEWHWLMDKTQACEEAASALVTFQFLISAANPSEFQLGAIEVQGKSGTRSTEKFLNMIYR